MAENLCLLKRGDQIICSSCDNPPPNSIYISKAPEGLEEGEYQEDDPRLAGVMEPGEGT